MKKQHPLTVLFLTKLQQQIQLAPGYQPIENIDPNLLKNIFLKNKR